MLTLEQLKQAIHSQRITKTDSALLCVAGAGAKAASTVAVRKLAIEAGVKGAKTINFSAHLSSAEDKVFKTSQGWELTDAGREYVAGSPYGWYWTTDFGGVADGTGGLQ